MNDKKKELLNALRGALVDLATEGNSNEIVERILSLTVQCVKNDSSVLDILSCTEDYRRFKE